MHGGVSALPDVSVEESEGLAVSDGVGGRSWMEGGAASVGFAVPALEVEDELRISHRPN